MAREKMSSFTADEAATVHDEEEATTRAVHSSNVSSKKKVSSKRSGDMTGGAGDIAATGGMHQRIGRKGSGPSGGSNGSGVSYVSPKGITQRSNKTLGWFLNDGLFSGASYDSHNGKNTTEISDCTSSPTVADTTVNEMKESFEKSNSMRGDDEKKRNKRLRQRSQKKILDMKQRTDLISNSEDAHSTKPTKGEYNKDDYWYYDPTSDGFYYENMGSRGWRRRVPVNMQKRLKVEQDIYAAFLRDPSQSAFLQNELYGFIPGMGAMTAAYYATPQIKYYDPASDGYYFEMPSVDGWKKRQPNSSSAACSGLDSSTNGFNYKSSGFVQSAFLHQQQPEVTSYGAALARGQLPPAYTLADSAVCSQEPFSSGASSMSTLSSLSEGTPTPPPPHIQMTASIAHDGSLFPDDDTLADYLAEQYDRALQLDELANEDNVESTNLASLHLPSCLFNRMESATYADVTASTCDIGDLENRPPNEESKFKRPGTLHLREASLEEDGQLSKESEQDEKRRDGHELLLNFNADKFIADIAYYGSNVERVLRDLAALKTPVAPSTLCSADSPHTPAICNSFPSWARAPDGQANTSNDWWLEDTTGTYIDEIWSKDASTCSDAKSKLSIWCDAELLTAVPCDNN